MRPHAPLLALLLAAALAGCNADNEQAARLPEPASKPENVEPLGIGQRVPDVNVTSIDGRQVSLARMVDDKPAVIIFYRGGWCPYCNTHLQELASIEPDLVDMGYRILAISPDKPSEAEKTLRDKRLSYRLFSDSDARAIRAFGLAFRVPDPLFTKYRDEYGIDLEASSGAKHRLLPVPAVYIVEKGGDIGYVHWDPDYKERLDADVILAEAGRVAA
jgi:peroxiredoxin